MDASGTRLPDGPEHTVRQRRLASLDVALHELITTSDRVLAEADLAMALSGSAVAEAERAISVYSAALEQRAVHIQAPPGFFLKRSAEWWFSPRVCDEI